MKRNIIFFLFLVLLFSACKKEDDTLFEQSPDERLNEELNKYQSALSSSPAGWKATLLLSSGDVYNFHFRFNNTNRVFMFADINSETAVKEYESSYRLKALQTPSLLFDTYSYLHILADPDASVNGGTYGQGLGADFEFSLDSLVSETIYLTGRKNGSKLKLIKATQQDLDVWQNGGWAKALSFENVNKILNYFKRVKIGGKDYEVSVNLLSRIITFTWIDGSGTPRQFSTEYNYGSGGIILKTPFNTGSEVVNLIIINSWDGTNYILNVSINGTATTIAGAARPLVVDAAAPRRWWQDAANIDAYWITQDGFHVNGVDDAYGLKTLDTKYYYFIYWPAYDPGSNDLFGPVFIDAAGTGLELRYGAAPNIPQFTSDGRAVFTLLGNYGPYPTTGPAAQTRTQLLSSQGYYFVQTGDRSYDMVSAADSKIWVSWVR
ncbi:DUF4302 domain-containing protein [Flavisolibacter tropicus]|uniref:DUF4302 domain-containing protein n=1 Tax=Flavisolibacter tropicus TaxID=1492898 RepID=A0A172U3Q4_9BACT|nr:DUF4302 domain-containing protein [Flavisolibacter tropicus]ANE53673.1 hypothetical protein SY85_22840 [Flavisolibacter tropicus]